MPIARPHVPSTVVVSGPGPQEPSQAGATVNLVEADGDDVAPPPPPQQNGASSAPKDPMASSTSLERSQSGDGDDDDAAVPAAPADPYAGLDSAFGGYMADEPRPQTQDLLDMI